MSADDESADTFVEQADYEKGFAAYYQQCVAPLLDNLEADRLKDYHQFVLASIFGGLLVLAAIALVITLGQHMQPKTESDTIFGAFALACAWPGFIIVRYSREAKTALLPPLLGFFGNLRYTPDADLPEVRLVPFNILPHHTTYDSETHITGALDDVGFDLAEITLVQGTGKNRHTVFNGLAVIFAMNKPFEGQTILEHHCGFLSNWLTGKISSLEAVTLEDPRFNQQFSVHATSQVEARYLLTTAFMQRLMDMSALMGNWGKNPQSIDLAAACLPSTYGGLRASFTGNSLLLLIPCQKELFSPGSLFASAYNLNEIRCVLYQVHLLRAMIETLKLNQHIGM